MARSSRAGLRKRVTLAARQYGISTVLFRHVVGERLGVNVTDMECLGLLFHQGIASPSELTRHTGLTSGATTAMLDRLEKAGMIERRPNPDDRRGTLIALVPAGARKVGPFFDGVRTAQEALLDRYSENELLLLADFFERSIKLWEEGRRGLQKKSTSKTRS